MATKKAASKKRYGAKASESVEREMKAFKKGTLKSGSGAKVKSKKQAIAVALSEARAEGGKVPPPPKAAKKSSGTKASKKKRAKKSSS